MSEHAPTAPVAGNDHGQGHDDPMSHVPPPSPWPILVCVALTILPFATLAVLGKLEFGGSFFGFFAYPFKHLVSAGTGWFMIAVGGLMLLFTLMGWAHQIIKEKPLSHDLAQGQSDLKFFTVCFLSGELAIFGAIFAYFYHRKIWNGEPFTVPPHMPFGGPAVAYATFVLISSSVTCEIAHHFLEHGKRGMAKLFLVATLLLGVYFLGCQGKEYGELLTMGFSPAGLTAAGYPAHASFASLFYTSTGFHGLHVAIGLIMLFMVLLRLQFGHFQGKRHFSAIAASWYWHFVDIVWVFLFITVYVVG
jgi:cytochrome c oxidase subunit III